MTEENEEIRKIILGMKIETAQDFARLIVYSGSFALAQATREAVEVHQYTINLAFAISKEILPVSKDLEEEMKKLEERLARNPNDMEARTRLTMLMIRHIARAFMIKNALIYFKITKEDILEVENYLNKHLEPMPKIERKTEDREKTEDNLHDTDLIMG
jgi:hypothetical protein